MTTPPRQPPPGQPGTGGQPPGERRLPRYPGWLWWVFLLGLLVWNLVSLAWPRQPAPLALSYTAFLVEVRAGHVAELTIAGQQVDGSFNQPIAREPDTTPTTSPLTGLAPAAQPATTTRFTTVLPPFPDEQLLPLLAEKGVVVSVRDPSAGNWLLGIITNLLPMLLLVGLLVMMSRQAQRGTQSLFGFGGSKARVYSSDRPGVTFADVAGEDEAKLELQEIVSFLQKPERFRALGARLPRGVLLVGPPGTGKTLLARAVAGEAGVAFYSISASEFVEMFVGVGASRVRDLFTKAKQEASAIVFVDELDAVGRQRGTGLGGGNDEREQTLNQLLVEMDGFDEQVNVIVLAATNRPDVLDPALLRPGRFDRQVTLTLPDRRGRQAILKVHTRKLPLAGDVDLSALAARCPGFSGADLSNLANEAALIAARRNGISVQWTDFDEAMDKIVLGTRQAGLLNEAERRLVAHHEGGHALVARLTPGADPVSKVTIIPHGRALGATQQQAAEDRHNYTREFLLGRLRVMLGGRAAEELVFGEPTTGAESDLREATALARRMVGLWGMSDDLGPVFYGLGDAHPFLGRELALPREYAEATAAALDRAVRHLIEEAHQQAFDLLQTNRSRLDALAQALLDHETVESDALDALLASPDSAHPDAAPALGPVAAG